MQVLINDYRPGAGIGWHRDKPQFGEVVGVSLLAPCNFRLRRKSGDAWDRFSLTVEPRSAYMLAGPSRTVWQHSVPPLDRHRYSITFRTLATIMDFTTNYVVVGNVGQAVILSASGFVLGPFVYYGHEKAWDYFGERAAQVDGVVRETKLLPAPA